ncbi:MAG: hypothetical protein WCS56_00195 [Bacilli bacterium]
MKFRVFVTWEPIPLENLKQARVYKALEAADKGDFSMLKDYTSSTGFNKVGGYEFDMREHMNRYVVKEKYCGWHEYYAVNKTEIRKFLGSHNVLEIQELDKKVA